MNKRSLTNLEVSQIEKSFLHIEDREYFTTLKMERRFFDTSKWKVESIFNTLILTYYNKNIVSMSFNDSTGMTTINGHSFKINKTKSIWGQIKILFEDKKSASHLYPLFIETAHAEQESLLDVKKFIIFGLLRHSTAEDNIKNSFKSADGKIALEEFNGVKLSSKDPISCATGKVTGQIKTIAKRTGSLGPEKTKAGLDTFKEEVEVDINFTARFNESENLEINMDMQKPANAKIQYLYNTTNHDYINRNPCEIKKIEKAPGGRSVRAKNNLTKDESKSDGLEFLINKINSALQPKGTHLVDSQLQVCFVYKGKNWTDSRSSLSADDYIDCISKICENKLKSIQVDTLGVPQINLTGKIEGKDLKKISELSKQVINDHSELLKELKAAKLLPEKYECETIRARCYMSTSDFSGNQVLEKAYKQFKTGHDYRDTAAEPLMTSVEVAKTYVTAAVACCLDPMCAENFNMRKVDPSVTPLKQGNL